MKTKVQLDTKIGVTIDDSVTAPSRRIRLGRHPAPAPPARLGPRAPSSAAMNRRNFFGLFALPFVVKAAPEPKWKPNTRGLLYELYDIKKSRPPGLAAVSLKERIEIAWDKYVAEHPAK